MDPGKLFDASSRLWRKNGLHLREHAQAVFSRQFQCTQLTETGANIMEKHYSTASASFFKLTLPSLNRHPLLTKSFHGLLHLGPLEGKRVPTILMLNPPGAVDAQVVVLPGVAVGISTPAQLGRMVHDEHRPDQVRRWRSTNEQVLLLILRVKPGMVNLFIVALLDAK